MWMKDEVVGFGCGERYAVTYIDLQKANYYN